MGEVVSIRSNKGVKCFDCGEVLREPQGFFGERITDDHYFAYPYHTDTECIRYLKNEIEALKSKGS